MLVLQITNPRIDVNSMRERMAQKSPRRKADIFQQQLREKAKYAPGFDDFAVRMTYAAGRYLMGLGFDGKTEAPFDEVHFVDFLLAIYQISKFRVNVENRLAWAIEWKHSLKKSRQNCNRAGAKIDLCLNHLLQANDLLRTEDEIRSLPFAPCRDTMRRLRKEISRLEAYNASLIHPTLRSEEEKVLAKKCVLHSRHPQYPRPDSSKMLNDLVELVEKQIRKFTDYKKIKDDRINRFMIEFFLEMDMHIPKDNIRMIRKRNKERTQKAKAQRSTPNPS